ncbi:protease FtsH subunit HflK [Modicisalibacter ilicicola DSM 19980]|uniref:Protein HflK n=1 Tax=Modicisalibacter ilicicola DSM 19980 TaxID=1121942 RepID=A0A1M4SBC9_9GAMM|nr:FtsH protease activity modulator HflK [Halomonas ilicicola]SHE29501.1 protease FtsH subunit HflK [Halomonas ilicicola DSM 19980]
MAWNEPGGGGNQHDPWSGGGRRGGGGNGGNNQGPPDLDEALKKFQDKLNKMLGGGRGRRGGGGSGGSGGGKRNAFALPGLLLIVALAIWAATGFYLVDQSERGVVLRFGKFQEVVSPGLHWNPPLIDDVRMVNVTRVRSISQTKSMLTQDENIVEVEMSAQYRVIEPRFFVLNVRDPDITIENALDSALRHVVGGTEMDQILTSGRELLADTVSTRLQTYLNNYNLGVTIQAINVESTSAPDAVQEAFDDVIKAREDRQRTINQAIGYANAIIPVAQGQAQRMIEQAQGYRESVVADAQGNSNRFNSLLSEYRNAPQIMRDRMYIETMSQVFSNTSKVLVDLDQSSPLMVLPLEQLQNNQDGSGESSEDAIRRSGGEAGMDPRLLDRLRNSSNSSQSESGNSIRREGR